MADHDFIFADEDLLDQQPHDFLAIADVDGFRRRAEPGQKRSERLGKAKRGGTVTRLIGNRLQLGTKGLFTLAQRRAALTQLIERDELFLECGDQPVETLRRANEFTLQRIDTAFGWIRVTRHLQATIEFGLDETAILDELDDLAPHNRIEKVLADRSIVADRSTKAPPAVGTQTAIIMDRTCACSGRRSIKRVAALGAGHDALRDAGLYSAAWPALLVVLQPLLGEREGRRTDDGRHLDLDPLVARSVEVGAVACSDAAAQAELSSDPLACRGLRLSEAGSSLVRRIAQHRPHHRALPASGSARRNLLFVQQARDRADAEPLHGVAFVDRSDNLRFRLDHRVIRGRLIALADIAIAVWRAAQDTDLAFARTVAFAATRSLENLRPLVFGDHTLKLQQQVVFRRRCTWRIDEKDLDAGARELFDQQNLISILAAQSIGREDEDGVDLTFSGEIAHALEAGADQACATITLVLEHPTVGHGEALVASEGDQCRRLAGDRVLLLLLVGRDPSVNRSDLHHRLLSAWFARPRRARSRRPESRKPARAWRRANGRRCIQDGQRAA